MKELVALAKDADAEKEFSSTRSDNSIHRVRNAPERQLGSLRSVIDNIRHDGGTPSLDSIATELSSMHTAQRASVLLALQRTHGAAANRGRKERRRIDPAKTVN
jgi:CHASE3 domain sensor protein